MYYYSLLFFYLRTSHNSNRTCENKRTNEDIQNIEDYSIEIRDRENICQNEENNDETMIVDKTIADDVLLTRIDDDEEEAGPSVRISLPKNNNSMDNNTTPISSSDEELENIFNTQKKARNIAENSNASSNANRDTIPNSEVTAASSLMVCYYIFQFKTFTYF